MFKNFESPEFYEKHGDGISQIFIDFERTNINALAVFKGYDAVYV